MKENEAGLPKLRYKLAQNGDKYILGRCCGEIERQNNLPKKVFVFVAEQTWNHSFFFYEREQWQGLLDWDPNWV